jgi:hypothetical protein
MRVTLAAVIILSGFVAGAAGIVRLAPEAPDWLQAGMSFLWLGVLIAGAYVFGNEQQGHNVLPRTQLRDGLIYAGIGFTLAAVVIAFGLRDIDLGIHRNIRANWVIGIITALYVCGQSVKDYWTFRRSWRLWCILAAYLALQIRVIIPVLGALSRIPGFFIWLIGISEYIGLAFVLTLVISPFRDEPTR